MAIMIYKPNNLELYRTQQQIQELLIMKKNKTLQQPQSLKLISWNINGNMDIKSSNYPIFIDQIKDIAHIYAFQETIGTKFRGYQTQKQDAYGRLMDADKVTDDNYGITSIYINTNIIPNYVPISIPESLYDNNHGTLRLYISSALLILPDVNICIINIYRPPITTIHGTKLHIKQLQNVINWIQQFLQNLPTEYLVFGDLNIWHESMGAPYRQKGDSMYFKYTLGDMIMQKMHQNKLINIHNGDPTMFKVIDCAKKEFHVDGIWATATLIRKTNIYTKFDDTYDCSDHYPGIITMNTMLRTQQSSDIQQIMKHWQINSMDHEKWQQFQHEIEQKLLEIHNTICQHQHNPVIQTEEFITTTLSTTLQTIVKIAQNIVGETKTGQLRNPWINEEILREIKQFRKEKRKIRATLNRIRNLRNKYRIIKQRPNHQLSQNIIKQHIGLRNYERYQLFNKMDKNKKRRIRWAKRRWLRQQTTKLVDSIQSQNWHHTIQRMEHQTQGSKQRIGRIIKPSVSIHPLDQQQRLKLKYTDFTTNDKETAEEIAHYMTTIGTKDNPAYKTQLKTSRHLAREYDQEFDMKNRNISIEKHKQEINKLNRKWEIEELKYALQCCKNKKGYYGDIHILFIKNGGNTLLHILLYVYEWWKNNGVNTNNMNTTLMNIILKHGKQHDIVKGMRPTQMAHPIFKIYAFMVLRRAEMYEIAMNIFSRDQYAAKKGSGSEDCLIGIVNEWNEMRHKQQSVAAVTFDSCDAFNCMHPLIIHDKMIHHMGFDMQALNMFKSLEHDSNVIVQINDTFTKEMPVRSSTYYQGFPLSQFIWCMYVNPLLIKIEKEQRIKDQQQTVIAKICIRSLMDDITIYTKILYWYYKEDQRDAYQKIIDKMKGNGEQRQKIPKQIQQQIVQMFQQSINFVKEYLNTNNVQINNNKTQLMIIQKEDTNKMDNNNKSRQNYQNDYNQSYDDIINNFNYKLEGKEMEKKPWIKLLGIRVDDRLNFEEQINYSINIMSNIRMRCYKLIENNKQHMSMDTMRRFIESMSMIHLNYGGCIILSLAKDINPLRIEYNKTINIMAGRLWNVSQIAKTIFNGFESFETKKAYILAKAWTKLLKTNERNGLYRYKQEYVIKITAMRQNVAVTSNNAWMEDDGDDIIRSLPNEYKYDMIIRWYIYNKIIHGDDSVMYTYMANEQQTEPPRHCTNIRSHHHIPKQPPNSILFIPYTTPWQDTMMETNKIYFATDGSIIYNNTNMQVYGLGGGGIEVYYNKNKIDIIMFPISTRTHINIAELLMINVVLEYVGDKRWMNRGISTGDIEGIVIITDSQNCLNLLQQRDHTNDEIMIRILQDIENQYQKMDQEWEKEFIQFYWVQSHNISKVNNDVDEVAKMAGKFLQITGWDEQTATEHNRQPVTTMLPYEFISYQQMKKEVKKKALLLQYKRWNQYKYTKKDDDWGQHLRQWHITGKKEWYQAELKYLNKQQNQIRILLYTGKIPTNVYLRFNLRWENISEFCECCDFGGMRREDTIGHRIKDCIANLEAIQELRKNVKMWHTIAKIEFNEDDTDKDYLKQFIFPAMTDPYIRMQIVKLTIDFMMFNDPGLLKLAEQYHKRSFTSN